VARLLLDEVPPERILCLTYTKAAAMEMQNRLFSRLGDWAMTPEDELRRRSRRSACPARA
jgi:ATP-dependent helicase/nuclease subunit A